MNQVETRKIRVYGIVQGVGFRPTVSRHAVKNDIHGSVCNKGPYVEIFAQGTKAQVDGFLEDLEKRPPKRAAILKINVEHLDNNPEFDGFEIIESEKTKGEIFVSPDIAICDECKEELYDPNNRRYLHPFINCTCCGPRMTILDALPYDRERTSMKEFPMCPECAEEYNRQRADEIVFYDITASYEGRGVFLDVVRETAKKVFVPLTVGGGIKTVDDIRETLRAGADKVSVNSQAVKNPQLIKDGADIFGSQCICVGIDAKKVSDGKWTVYINGGRVDMGLDLIEWVHTIEKLGAGEICLNSIDADGTKEGFDIPMLKAVCDNCSIPVIASGGAGKINDFCEVFEKTGATAALAASLFHFKELTVGEVKNYCRSRGVIVR